jgi:hypothetical protein
MRAELSWRQPGPLAKEGFDIRGDPGRSAGSGPLARARAAATAEAVQPAADGFVGPAGDGGDRLQGVALMRGQGPLGARAAGLPGGLPKAA